MSTASKTMELMVRGGLAAWLAATALSQHPNREFDRCRKLDKSGVAIPNWRFFAPEPCKHDFRVLHRTLCDDGTQTHWQETHSIAERRPSHMIWFPQRRRDKGINDVCNELIKLLQNPEVELATTPAYRVLRDQVRSQIVQDGATPRGFQFLVVTDGGYDEDEEIGYIFASRFEPWTPDE